MSVMDRPTTQQRGGGTIYESVNDQQLQETAKDIVAKLCSFSPQFSTINPLEYHIWNELKSQAPKNPVANFIVDMVRSGQSLRQFLPRDLLHNYSSGGGGTHNSNSNRNY